QRLASRRLPGFTTARPGLGLVLGLERPGHVAGTLPRPHQLGIIAEPIPDHPVQQAELLADVRGRLSDRRARLHARAGLRWFPGVCPRTARAPWPTTAWQVKGAQGMLSGGTMLV